VKVTLHTSNGKLRGAYYDLDGGRRLYLAHRTPRMMVFGKQAWAIEESVLRNCQAEGIIAVGVVMRFKGKPIYYLTRGSDFHLHPESFSYFKDYVSRALPTKFFLINPGTTPDAIDAITSIGR